MAGKARVHELAKEFNVTSKEILQKLNSFGEFVKSASSTVEAPVARRLREYYDAQSTKSASKKTEQPKESSAKDAPAPTQAVDAPSASQSTSKKAPEGGASEGGASEGGAPTPRPSAQAEQSHKPQNSKRAATAPENASSPSKQPQPGSKSEEPARGGATPASHAPHSGEAAAHKPAQKKDSHSQARPRGPQSAQPARPGKGSAAGAQPGQPASPAQASAQRPQPRPSAAGPRPMPRPQRVANNPYSSGNSGSPSNRGPRPQGPSGAHQGLRGGPKQPGNPGASGRPSRPGGPGGNRPHSVRPGGPGGPGGPGADRQRPAGHAGHSGAAPSPSNAPRRGGFGAGAASFPSSGATGLAGAAAGRGRGPAGGRPGGGTGGAFGRQGSAAGRKSKKSKKQKKSEFDMMEAPQLGGIRLPRGDGQVIRLARGASLSDFAEKINVNPASLVQALFKLGEMATATQSVSEETLQILGAEMNFEVQVVSPEDEDRELLENFDLSFGENAGVSDDLVSRPPVVTVMGHVDHGKTRLLDTIRKSNVRSKEAGGITQHIGAYQVSVDFEGSTRPVTFIDTPGHEAFTAMRARGAKATDIAVLVVAADDGVMPQTVEAVNHAQAAGVPIVVAVNKIDKPDANPEKIRAQLTEYNLVAEEYGGQTMFVDISAMNGSNIDKLLEAILLTADAELNLVANPDMPAQGVAIEAHLDRGRGPVATVIVQRGTLRVGDSVVAGDAYGRVRRMVDENGVDVEFALPSRPIQVIGFTSVPGAGDNLLVVEEDRIARQIADRRSARKRNALQARAKKRISLEDLDTVLKETTQLNLILKGDNAGTVEALEEALLGIDVGDEVQLRVIDRGVGGVTETNVNLAAASDGIIIAFNVRPEGKAGELANREGVEIRYYSIIYNAIDEVRQALLGLLKPVYEEKELGKVEIREIFKSSKVGLIAGCLVAEGIVKRNAHARLVRDNVVVQDTMTIASLRREKDDVNEVREGYECGITLTYTDFKIGDIIESYELVEKPRT